MAKRKPKIRHKVRGLRIGPPEGLASQEITVFVRGEINFERDAMELFSFLFTKVPDGTIRALLRIINEKLDTVIADDMSRKIQKVNQVAMNGRMRRPIMLDPKDVEQLNQFDLFNNSK